MNEIKEYRFDNAQTFVEKVGRKVLEALEELIAKKGKVYLAISGGNTPLNLFKYWATQKFEGWKNISLFWVDERFVPIESDQNNAYNALLILNKLPFAAVHRIDTRLSTPQLAAQNYELLLNRTLPIVENTPQFDLILLGMGGDGHTASLFPKTSILEEHTKVVDSVHVENLQSWRVSLTYKTILAAQKRYVIIGSGKEEAFSAAKSSESNFIDYPIKKIMELGSKDDIYFLH